MLYVNAITCEFPSPIATFLLLFWAVEPLISTTPTMEYLSGVTLDWL